MPSSDRCACVICVYARIPNIKAISWNVFEHVEVIRSMVHLEYDRFCRLQHLNIHLFCRLILHIHRVILKDKRWWEWGKNCGQVNFISWKILVAVPVTLPLENSYICSKLPAVLRCCSANLHHVQGKKTNRMGDWRTDWCSAAWWQSCMAIQIAGPLWRRLKWEHARNCLLWVCCSDRLVRKKGDSEEINEKQGQVG